MPSGYTADIADGTIKDFPVFAMRCARAFGALIEMRDDPMDTPIPETLKRFDSDSRYHEKLREARDELDRLRTMSPIQIALDCDAAYEKEMKSWDENCAERNQKLARYEAMLNMVYTWMPPSEDHVKMKEFMIEQITQSIDWDCKIHMDWMPKLMSPSEWHAHVIDRAIWDVNYYEEQLEKELQSKNDSNLWLSQLRDSLKDWKHGQTN